MKNKKYRTIFNTSDSKKEFIEICKHKYPNLKTNTFERRWYELQKDIKINRDTKLVKDIYFSNELESIKPNKLKQIELEDMKQYNIKLTKKKLKQYGFTMNELKWLREQGKI